MWGRGRLRPISLDPWPCGGALLPPPPDRIHGEGAGGISRARPRDAALPAGCGVSKAGLERSEPLGDHQRSTGGILGT